MRYLFSVVSLSLLALPALAVPGALDTATIPEPGVLGLVGIGAVALLVAHRRGRK